MKKQDGFGLIDLIVVTTIMGILGSVAIPNFMLAKDNAKNSKVQASAHNLQLALEQYASDHSATYPVDAAALKAEVVSDLNLLNAGNWAPTPWGTQQAQGIAWPSASEFVAMGDRIALGGILNPSATTHYGALCYAIASTATVNDKYLIVGTGKKADNAIVAIVLKNF